MIKRSVIILDFFENGNHFKKPVKNTRLAVIKAIVIIF